MSKRRISSEKTTGKERSQGAQPKHRRVLINLSIAQFNRELLAAGEIFSKAGIHVFYLSSGDSREKLHLEEDAQIDVLSHTWAWSREIQQSGTKKKVDKIINFFKATRAIQRDINDLAALIIERRITAVIDSSWWGVNQNLLVLEAAKRAGAETVHIPCWWKLGGKEGFAAYRRLSQNPESREEAKGWARDILARAVLTKDTIRDKDGIRIFSHSPYDILLARVSGIRFRDSWCIPSPLFDRICVAIPECKELLRHEESLGGKPIVVTGRPSLRRLFLEHQEGSRSEQEQKRPTVLWSPSPYLQHQILNEDEYGKYLRTIGGWLNNIEGWECLVSVHPVLTAESMSERLGEYKSIKIEPSADLTELLACKGISHFLCAKDSSTWEIARSCGVSYSRYNARQLVGLKENSRYEYTFSSIEENASNLVSSRDELLNDLYSRGKSMTRESSRHMDRQKETYSSICDDYLGRMES